MVATNKNKRKMPSLSSSKQRQCKASNIKPKKATVDVARKNIEPNTHLIICKIIQNLRNKTK